MDIKIELLISSVSITFITKIEYDLFIILHTILRSTNKHM